MTNLIHELYFFIFNDTQVADKTICLSLSCVQVKVAIT